MNGIPISVIIKEYYNIVSPILTYKTCERINVIEKQLLSLLCEVNNCSIIVDECWAMIDSAKCLQTCSDGALLASSDTIQHNIVNDIKMDALTSCRINIVKNFDEFTFIEDLKSNANSGEKNSCKLLAFLNWMGLIVSQNTKTAQNIWASLAMIGDWLSIKMLMYGYAQLGETKKAIKWTHIYDILKTEYEVFSAIAIYSNYSQYTEEEVQIANLIMFISQKAAAKGVTGIDRPMIHYVLNSKDDYKAKMEKLSTDTNYYIALHVEDKFSNKKYGF